MRRDAVRVCPGLVSCRRPGAGAGWASAATPPRLVALPQYEAGSRSEALCIRPGMVLLRGFLSPHAQQALVDTLRRLGRGVTSPCPF